MSRPCTVVMYHYVRDLKHSRFPGIKGLSVERFHHQLDYIQSHYTPIAAENLLEAIASAREDMPPNPILLTFDDGYSDHFANVFPLLDARGIRGCFFPPAQAVLEHKVLDVNKIQFVLASISNPESLLERVFSLLEEFRSEHELKSREAYLCAVSGEHRYDSHVVYALKRLLQNVLPGPVRTEIVRRLFAEYVSSDETAFACELYMSIDQIRCMRRHGMHIGSHGYSHGWLNHISSEEQAIEVDQSLDFLEKVGAARNEWTMCYPYGGFNDSLLRVLSDRQCRLGFTVEARIADLSVDNTLLLPRLDTNDLPS